MKSTLVRAGLVALVVSAFAGCGGGGGGDGGTAPPPVVTPPPGATLPPAPVPPGSAPIALGTITSDQFAALQPTIVAGGAIVASPPQISFALQDQNGNAIKGLADWTTKSSTATVASYPNIAFSIAKLIPGTNGAPSKWVSYIITTVPSTTTAAAPTRPSTDNTGTLTDNGNGTYVYKFYRDITKIKDDVAGMTVTAPNNKDDLGDLTYDPNAVHRITIAFYGNMRGTGTNTADGTNSGVTAVPIKHPVNFTYDFIPATGKAVTATDPSRKIVATAKCNECHRVLGGIPGLSPDEDAAAFHGSNRNNADYCVVCHTDQRRYGYTEATMSGNAFTTTNVRVVDGRAVGNFPNYIHKTHLGAILTKQKYNYGGLLFNEIHYPQDVRNCTKCHDGSDTSTAKTANGNNWKEVPSRLACGACHDGINFATGKGVTLEDARNGLTVSQYGHIGGAQADDSKCALCHAAAAIDVYHLPVTPPNKGSSLHVAGGNNNTNAAWIASNTSRLPEGAIKVSYDIKSVSMNASNQPVMVFRLLQNGARKDLSVFSTATNNPATGRKEIWDNFMGSPSVYWVWSDTQDGITSPSDFTASASVYLRGVWDGSVTAGTATISGPDTDGYYTVTRTGTTLPATAKMLTGGLGYSYNVSSTLPLTQTNLLDYPVPDGSGLVNAGATNKTGGLIVIAPNAQVVATGYTGRRAIVEDKRCNACHQELGTFTEEAFHGGQRNDGTTCSWCHTPNRASSGWSADSTVFIHAIHAAAKREVKFNWHAVSATEGFWLIHYPGILNDCETCHLPDTYAYNTAAQTTAFPNRLHRLTASGTLTASDSLSPWVVAGTNYGTGGAGTNLVTSPTVSVCSACHDSSLARTHMAQNGGSFYKDRTTSLATTETCELCHFVGKVADIKVMHSKNR